MLCFISCLNTYTGIQYKLLIKFGEMNNSKIIIIGSGLFADEIADMIAMAGNMEIEAFVESIDSEKCKVLKAGKPVIWIDDIRSLKRSCQCICSIGSPKRTGIIKIIYDAGFSFISLIHPSAQIFPSASINEGSIIGAGSILAAGAKIGKQVIVNRGCLIGHHTIVEDFVTISPGANIAGKITIGENAFIGMGAIVLDGIKIGKGSVIGSGAVVTHDVPDHVQVMGIPARITKELH